MRVLWLYSYPKTGSTWVRRVIQEIIAPDQSPFDAITSIQYDIPDNLRFFDIRGKSTTVFKTHNIPSHSACKELTHDSIGYISIYRHPLDVLLSSLNYSYAKRESRIFKYGILKSVDDIIKDGEIGYYVGQFIHHQGCRRYVKWCGSYIDYYKNWETATSGKPRLVLKYEDVVNNKIEAISHIADYLGYDNVNCSDISAKIEGKTAIDGQFHWRKKAYNFDGYVPQRIVSKFERSCADLLDYFGYEPTINHKSSRDLASI